MNLLSVDPGAKSGWAQYYCDKLYWHGTFRITSIRGAKFISELFNTINPGKWTLLIEDQHPGGYTDTDGKHHPVSHATSIAMGMRRGQWVQEALKTGMKIATVKAIVWQSAMLKTPGVKMDRYNLKVASMKRASQIAGREITDDNEADAIVMGQYWIEENGMKGI